MKPKRGILLFEVMLAVILISLASLFLFRGYSIFIKAARKGTDYLQLILLCEKKVWDLSLEEKDNQITNTTQTEGSLDSRYKWIMRLEDTGYEKLKQANRRITDEVKNESFDTVMYLISQE